MIKYFIFSIIIAVALASCISSSNKAIYISPTGDDTNVGTKKAPLRTMAQAIVLSRLNDIKKIYVREGEYFDVNIQLTPKDKNLSVEAYRNEKPIFYGGNKVEKWTQEGELFITKIENVDAIRFFTVNNQPRERAKLPTEGTFQHRNIWTSKWLSTSAGGWDIQPTKKQLTTLMFKNEDIGTWFDFKNAELSVYHEWDESQAGIESMDTIKNTFTLQNELTHPPGAFVDWNKNADKYVVYNVKQGLTKAGSWFFDKNTSYIYYHPLDNETIDNINAVYPTQKHIIEFMSETTDVKFKGIILSTTTASLRNPGYAATYIDACIETGKNVKNIVFEKMTIENHAGWGVNCNGKNISFIQCTFRNLGAGGIKYHGNDIKIEKSIFHDLGLVYKGAVGILGSGENNSISHSEFYNMPYCAINNIGNKSVVDGCLFYNIKTFMQDGGAIYQIYGDSVIYKNNVTIFDKNNKREILAYYFDEKSTRCVATNNLALNTNKPVNSHMAKDIVFNNNIFIDQSKQKLAFTRSSDVIFDNNVLIADTIIFETPLKAYAELHNLDISGFNEIMKPFVFANGIVSLKNNIFYSLGNTVKRKKIIHGFDNLEMTEMLEQTSENKFIDIKTLKSGKLDIKEIKKICSNANIDFRKFLNVGCTNSFERLFHANY